MEEPKLCLDATFGGGAYTLWRKICGGLWSVLISFFYPYPVVLVYSQVRLELDQYFNPLPPGVVLKVTR